MQYVKYGDYGNYKAASYGVKSFVINCPCYVSLSFPDTIYTLIEFSTCASNRFLIPIPFFIRRSFISSVFMKADVELYSNDFLYACAQSSQQLYLQETEPL